jgi:hypothetical protein
MMNPSRNTIAKRDEEVYTINQLSFSTAALIVITVLIIMIKGKLSKVSKKSLI